MMMIFLGAYPQIVTELGKVFEPKTHYKLQDSELVTLGKRGFMHLFSSIDASESQDRPLKVKRKHQVT